jgi:putative molybdopterin biosynthesis protein
MQGRAKNIVGLTVSRLAELRKKKGLSQDELATRAGITRAAVSFIESGKRKPSLLVTLKLANALEIELSSLLRKAERVPFKAHAK